VDRGQNSQLTIRETIAAGTYVVFDMLCLFCVVAFPALVANLFSPAFPRRWKVGNALTVLLLLALAGAAVALPIVLIARR
jgi:hypothetical protein